MVTFQIKYIARDYILNLVQCLHTIYDLLTGNVNLLFLCLKGPFIHNGCENPSALVFVNIEINNQIAFSNIILLIYHQTKSVLNSNGVRAYLIIDSLEHLPNNLKVVLGSIFKSPDLSLLTQLLTL